MARRPRLDLPDIPQHVIQRGNNRTVCFFEDVDYITYLEFLALAAEKAACRVHAYVLMTNHVHLLLTGSAYGSVSLMMQSLGRRYVRYINEKYQRSGTLWEGRYKSCLVDSEHYLLACYRYIEMNPVRAGLAHTPCDYAWSSFRHHANELRDPLIEEHGVFLSLGASREERATRYRFLFQSQLAATSVKQIRFCANRGYALGSEQFNKQIAAVLKRRVTPGKPGRPR